VARPQAKRRIELEQKQDSARKRTLERELDWVRMAPRARQAKSKARLSSYEQLLAEDQARKNPETSEIHIPAGERLGQIVVQAEHLSKAFGERCSSTTSRSTCRAAASSA
jgi:sulfate-transporting ATPase